MPNAFLSSLYEIRDFAYTAYVTLSTNTETLLFAGSTANFYDPIYICATTNSTVTGNSPVRIDIRDGTGSNVVATINTNGEPINVRLKQNAKNNTWTVKYNNTDVSGTTSYISAVFIQET